MFHPAVYRIHVAGRLGPEWSDRLQGMAVVTVEARGHGPVTEIRGLLPDQAALMGVLDYLYNSGIPLLDVAYVQECCPGHETKKNSQKHPETNKRNRGR